MKTSEKAEPRTRTRTKSVARFSPERGTRGISALKVLIPKHVKVVAVDTETSGFFPDDGDRVACVAVAWQGGSLALPFGQGREEEGVTCAGEAMWCRLLNELRDRRLVFHNAIFDLAMLRAGTKSGFVGTDLKDRLEWDTMLGARTLHPLMKAGLDEQAAKWLGEGKEGLDALTGWLKEHKIKVRRYDLAPWEVVEPYVTADAEKTIALYEQQGRETLTWSVRREIERELELTKVLIDLERRGVGYDSERSEEVARELTAEIERVSATMPFVPSINKAKAYFFDECELKADRQSEKTGAPSLDAEQVRDWAAAGVPWAKEYAQVNWAKRAVSMWYAGYPAKIGPDGRLRGRYRQGTVASGRLSIERIQLQAIPKADKIKADVPGVRDLLLPKKGYALWSLDMQQAELRVAAKYAKCWKMVDMLIDGADFHGRTCEATMDAKPTDKDWKVKRDVAKRLTFGSIFMIGGETFQRTLAKQGDVHWPLQECVRVVHAWRATYPQFGWASRKCERLFGDRGYMKILPGTEYESRSYLREWDHAHTGWSRCVQGSLAAFLRLWLVAVERAAPGKAILTVHDSVVLELKEGEDEVASAMAALGAELAESLFDLPMPCEIERLA